MMVSRNTLVMIAQVAEEQNRSRLNTPVRVEAGELSANHEGGVGVNVGMEKSIETRAADALDAIYEETMSKHVNIASCRDARRAIIVQAIRDALADVGVNVGVSAPQA
jgi:hypothetical protein